MAQNHQLSDPNIWVDQYGDYLYSFALRRMPDESAAQDAVQEALMAALRARDKFKGTSSEKTWLTGILKHKLIDAIRKKYKETPVDDRTMDFRMQEEYGFNKDGSWNIAPKKWSSNPEQLLTQKRFLSIVQTCLEGLPQRPAKALALKALDGESTKVICKVLNISTTNAWVILHRARTLMRKCIEANWIEEKT